MANGVWLGEDPVPGESRFGYASWRPISRVDSSGLSPAMDKAISDKKACRHTDRAGRRLWRIDKSAPGIKSGFGKHYRFKGDGLYWSDDLAGHGGSAFKVHRLTAKGLEWVYDAGKYGNFISEKHKGDVGRVIQDKLCPFQGKAK